MRGKLRIGKTVKGKVLSLPIDTVTQTTAILAIRSVGKTFTGSVMAEEMLEHDLQIVILDPTDAWWGLKASADGKREGYNIVVFGGEHQDLPLDVGSAHLVADLVTEEQISVILCLTEFNKAEQCRFVTAFAQRLYYNKRKTKYQTPLHMYLDEADEFAPQKPAHGETHMLGAVDRVVRRGRNRGIGVTLISQRAAVVNKNVLSQVQMLIALRTVGKWDLEALEGWIKYHGAQEQKREFIRTIVSLRIGEAWVWSPGWLHLFERVQIRRRRTFDSSATPKVGERRREPKRLSKIDLESIRVRMVDVVERAEREDPKKLHAEIIKLRRQLQVKAPAVVPAQVDPNAVRDAVTGAVQTAVAERDSWWAARLKELSLGLQGVTTAVHTVIEKAAKIVESAPVIRVPKTVLPPSRVPRRSDLARPSRVPSAYKSDFAPPPESPLRSVAGGEVTLAKGERKILTVLAQRNPELTTKRQLAVLTGYSMRSGSFSNLQGSLRRNGFLEGRDTMSLTEAGLAALGDFEPLPVGEALVDYWRGQLGRGAPRRVFDVLIDAYPDSLSKEEIAERCGYALSGTFSNALGKLRTLQLAEGRERLKINDQLYGG